MSLVLVCSALFAQQQNHGSSASEDAMKWLTEKIDAFGNYTFTYKCDGCEERTTSLHQKLSVSNCQVELSTTISLSPEVSSKGTMTAYFGYFDPATIEVQELALAPSGSTVVSGPQRHYLLRVYTRNKDKRVEQSFVGNDGRSSSGLRADLYFDLSDSDIAHRAIKALTDAINGCQGSKEKY
jgi:hypothetical protein